MNYDALIEQYLAGPGLLRRAVAGMTRDQLLARPVPGKWSTQEVVCHLADYEPIYAGVGPFPRLVEDAAWVRACAKLIQEEGAEQFLVNLLHVLRECFREE